MRRTTQHILRASRRDLRIEVIEALSTRAKGRDLYRPQDFKAHLYTKRTQHEAEKMARTSG